MRRVHAGPVDGHTFSHRALNTLDSHTDDIDLCHQFESFHYKLIHETEPCEFGPAETLAFVVSAWDAQTLNDYIDIVVLERPQLDFGTPRALSTVALESLGLVLAQVRQVPQATLVAKAISR
jgi:hypothetical protein